MPRIIEVERGEQAQTEIRFEPNSKAQNEFFAAAEYEVLYGGASFNGKSLCLVIEPMRYLQYQDFNAIIFRRTYQEIIRSLDPYLRKYYYAAGGSYNEQKKRWTFPAGSYIDIGYMEHESDWMSYQGSNYTAHLFDELTQFQWNQYKMLAAWNRSASAGIQAYRRATTNPGGSCVPFGDVLTPDGWRDIRDIRVGDVVWSVKQDGELVRSRASKIFCYDYDGDICDLTMRGLRMVCTPNHKVASVIGTKSNRGKKNFNLTEFSKLQGQANILRSVDWKTGVNTWCFEVPPVEVRTPRKDKTKQPTLLPITDFCALLGWFLSEGWASTKKGARSFGIAQEKPEHRAKIEKLLRECRFRFSVGKSQFIVSSPAWAEYFSQFGKCREKFIPHWVKNLPKDKLWILFEAMMNGDGHWVTGKSSGAYHTISKQLADDVSELCLKLGFVVKMRTDQQRDRVGPRYTVSFKTIRSCGTEILTGNHIYNVRTETKRKTKIKRYPFQGKIYCIEVAGTHSFIIRQQGSIWVSGNSHTQVKRHFVDTCPPINDGPLRYSELTKLWWQPKKPGPTYWYRDENDQLLSRRFIPASVFENEDGIRNNPNYISQLLSLEPNKRRAFLDGDWNVFEGVFFEDWRDEIHIIDPPSMELVHSLPPTALRGCIDYGNKTCLEVGFRDYEGNIVLFLEVYSEAQVPTDRADQMIQALKDYDLSNLFIRYDTNMDYALEYYTGYDKSPIEIFRQRFKEKMGDKAPTFAVVSKKSEENRRYRLACNEAMKQLIHWKKRPDGSFEVRPKFYSSRNCKIFNSTITELIHDPDSQSGLDFMQGSEVPDHAFDSGKMLVMDLRVPQKYEPKKKFESADEWMRDEIRKIEEKALRGGGGNWQNL